MAKPDDAKKDGADSWPGFLSELTKSFLILRDIFGYALPGAVFISIGVLFNDPSMSYVESRVRAYSISPWLGAVLGLGACYTIGHLMAHFAYFFSNVWRFPLITKWWESKHPPSQEQTETGEKGRHDQVQLILLRAQRPEVLTELDRQSLMGQLRGGTGAAMVAAWCVFAKPSGLPLAWLILPAGLFLLIVFWFSANPHMRDLRANTVEAGKLAEAADKQEHAADKNSLKQALIGVLDAVRDDLKK